MNEPQINLPKSKTAPTLQRLDITCDEFEAEWLDGTRPDLESYIESARVDDRKQLLVELVRMDLEYRRETGELPRADEYVNRFSGYEQEIRSAFSAERTLRQFHFGESTKVRPPHVPIPVAKTDQNSSTEFGNYELLSEIARGGMGVVYKARQKTTNRIVALKMLLSGQLACHDEVERFKAEAQAAAALDHPNIVPIFEVGKDSEQHFFSMAYVDGASLKEHLAKGPVDPRTAAEMVRVLAEAIAYAHGQGIIHRDLKPANILLDSAGQLRITDFGLSKIVDSDKDLTGTGQLLGTPSYMSPEQAAGDADAIGAQSDVYALGCILYVMISGRVPFSADSILETLHQVRTENPVPPRSLNIAIDRDIETICLKCLSKEPTQRYPTAHALADDLNRYLKYEPIAARPVSAVQRLVRWSKRWPTIAALIATIIGLAILLGPLTIYFAVTAQRKGVTAQQQQERAAENLNTATEVVKQLVEQAESLANVPQTETHRQQLLDKASTFYKRFLEQRPNDAQLRSEAANVHHKMGDMYRLLREITPSRSAYHQAIRLLDELATEFPLEMEYTQRLAESNIWLSVLLNPSDMDEALEAINRAVAIQEVQSAEFPNNAECHHGLARALFNRGMIQFEFGETEAAESNYLIAIRLLNESLAAASPSDSKQRLRDLARALNNYGNLLKSSQRLDEAKTKITEAVDLLKAQRDLDREGREELAIYHNNLSNTLALKSELAAAVEQNVQAMLLLEKLVNDFPRYPNLRNELANTFNSRGALAGRSKDYDAAASSFALAEEAFSHLLTDYPSNAQYMNRFASSKYNVGVVQFMQKSLGESISTIESAISLHQQAVDASPQNDAFSANLLNDYKLVIRSYLAEDDFRKAEIKTNECLDKFTQRIELKLQAAKWLGKCHQLAIVDSKSPDDAEPIAKRTIALLRDVAESKELSRTMLADDAALDPFQSLKDRADFKQLVADLNEANPKPKNE